MPRAKSLMILGTASGVGKSFITAAFCRLFSDWGLSVAPFKAQNMSNNSAVTADGLEIARAQAVQAECARAELSADMNPVLLKPAADDSSQVIMNGRALGHFKAREYFGKREMFEQSIHDSYDRLAARHDLIVLEGAGSPAEINLKKNDLTNLKMAEWAGAPCLLVGDIDRGGVFASLVGTLELLDRAERSRIHGFVINKFRGDESLLKDGLSFLEERTGKKVYGVLPYDREIWIPEEDSLDLSPQEAPGADALDIAVVLLPRMSNFTDFEILRHEPGVRLRYVRAVADLGAPDLLVLPGTKSTCADLDYLRQTGMAEAIVSFARRGGCMLGVCGGFQMLGEKIIDSQGAESESREVEGLGFFKMTTVFEREKIVRRVNRELDVRLFGARVRGRVEAYEIHMGRTMEHWGLSEGVSAAAGDRIAGTYYHGLFESASFRKAFLDALAEWRGKKASPAEAKPAREIREINYNRLAGLLRRHLNLEALCDNLGIPMPLEARK